MKRWLPYALAIVAGLVAVVLMFGPGLGGGTPADDEEPAKAKGEERRVTRTAGDADEGVPAEPGDEAADGAAEGVAPRADGAPPPRGTLRPMTKAERELEARLARPYNEHYSLVSAWWMQTERLLIKKGDRALSEEAGRIDRYLRDQSQRNDDTLDVPATLAEERAVIEKVRAAHGSDPEIARILGYISASADAVEQGKDPGEVPKPPKL